MRYSTSYADPDLKKRDHLQKASGVLSLVTPPSTNRALRCLSSVIKWVPVCPMWQDVLRTTLLRRNGDSLLFFLWPRPSFLCTFTRPSKKQLMSVPGNLFPSLPSFSHSVRSYPTTAAAAAAYGLPALNDVGALSTCIVTGPQSSHTFAKMLAQADIYKCTLLDSNFGAEAK
jgi:hypothetical protein